MNRILILFVSIMIISCPAEEIPFGHYHLEQTIENDSRVYSRTGMVHILNDTVAYLLLFFS